MNVPGLYHQLNADEAYDLKRQREIDGEDEAMDLDWQRQMENARIRAASCGKEEA